MTDLPVMLITGTRKGIGRSLAEHYSKEGWIVIGCSRGDADMQIPNYSHFLADVSDEIAVKAMFTEIRKKYGRLDVLINNAGVASMNHALLTPLETTRKVLDTNFIGTKTEIRTHYQFFNSSCSAQTGRRSHLRIFQSRC
jgi:3-oxoacyl-[acyl-carrier protein] reductase